MHPMLLQAFMLAAMEPPDDMSAAAIGRAKVALAVACCSLL